MLSLQCFVDKCLRYVPDGKGIKTSSSELCDTELTFQKVCVLPHSTLRRTNTCIQSSAATASCLSGYPNERGWMSGKHVTHLSSYTQNEYSHTPASAQVAVDKTMQTKRSIKTHAYLSFHICVNTNNKYRSSKTVRVHWRRGSQVGEESNQSIFLKEGCHLFDPLRFSHFHNPNSITMFPCAPFSDIQALEHEFPNMHFPAITNDLPIYFVFDHIANRFNNSFSILKKLVFLLRKETCFISVKHIWIL